MEPHGISLREAAAVWGRIALLSFGGPAGQIALMHRVLVEEKRWIGEARFLHALNYCMLLPGPEAQQLATYIGWLMHRTVGGLIAGLLFLLPGFLSILALSFIYVLLGSVPWVVGLFFGLKCAVLAIVAQAIVRLSRKALKSNAAVALAAGSFAALFLFDLPFPLLVLAAGLIGLFTGKFAGMASHGTSGGDDHGSALGEQLPAHARPGWRWSARISALLLLLWMAPVAGLLLSPGPDSVFSRIALLFSETAVVTFGGAYAVLGYVAQRAVEGFGWLTPREMVDGLAMAETTPGPLIMVVQFVGFMAAFRNPGAMDPLLAATLGAVLTSWVTFVPCFLWIFLGAPFAERLRANRALASALGAISAAVVGVIGSLALWFAIHVLFARTAEVGGVDLPDFTSIQAAAVLLSAAAMVALFRLQWSVPAVLGASAVAGVILKIAGLVP